MSDFIENSQLKAKVAELELALEKANNKVICEARSKSKWKRLYEGLGGDKKPTRGENAEALISRLIGTGRPIDLIKTIADKCFLSEGYVSVLWYTKK